MTIDVKPSEMQTERRDQQRERCGISASLRERGRSAHFAQLIELSPAGCKLVGSPLVGGLDSPLWLMLPGAATVEGRCIWSDGKRTGVAFDRTMSGDMLDHLVRSFPPVDDEDAAEKEQASRLEKIRVGYAEEPLLRRKKPLGDRKLTSLIAREVSRMTSQRCETRFPIEYATAPDTIDCDGRALQLRDISPSGLGINGIIDEEIGASLALSFPDCDPIEGRVVWQKDGRTGIELDRDAISLNDNDA